MKSLSIGTEVCGSILLDLIQFIGLFSSFFPDSLGPQSCGRGFCQNRGNYKQLLKKLIHKISAAPLFRSQQMIQREKSGLRLMVL